MIEAISTILEAVAKYAWGVFFVCLFVILLPTDTSKSLGLEKIKLDYLGFCWLGLIFSATICVSNWFSEIRGKARQKAVIIKRLRTLDLSEYKWIAYCLFHNVQTLSATAINQTANSLLNKGIITQGSGNILSLPFHIRDFVWEYLRDHKEDFLPREVRDNPETMLKLKAFADSLKELF